MSESMIGTYEGMDIYLRSSDGFFFARLKTGPVQDGTLAGLKRKLQNIKRASAREQAIALPAVVLEYGGRWGDDEESLDKWYKGTFVGVNAHTGEITLEVGKDRAHVSEYAVFFRPDDPAIELVRAALKNRRETFRAAEKAKKVYEDLARKHGHRVTIRERGDKTRGAADAEQRLIDFLAPKEGK